MELKILSFNIRCANDPDGHSIEERAPRVRRILDTVRADIIGIQEYRDRWEPYWDAARPEGYRELKIDRGDGEGLVLFWRPERLECLDKGHFWFADDPTKGDTAWDEKYHKPRICGWCVFRERESGKIFTYMNLHYGFGAEGHLKNARLLGEYAKKLGDHPTVITGDFNMRPETPGYGAMAAQFTDVNAATAREETLTYHGYGKPELAMLLDYCFVSSRVQPLGYRVLMDTFQGKYPSDHYPIEMRVGI